MAETYYLVRSRVDPDWLEQENASARRWYAKLRKTDPERFQQLRAAKTERDRRRRATLTDEERTELRARDRERKRRARAKLQTHIEYPGLTLADLEARIGSFGERTSLKHVLDDEIRRGHVELRGGVYSVNGGLDAETKRALLDLGRIDAR